MSGFMPNWGVVPIVEVDLNDVVTVEAFGIGWSVVVYEIDGTHHVLHVYPTRRAAVAHVEALQAALRTWF